MNNPARLLVAIALASLLVSRASGGDFHLIPNIAYVPNGTEARTGDIYLPNGGITPMPAVIVIHGGGWVHGDNQAGTTIFISQELAGAGYAAFNINYRLVGQGGEFPADVQDVKDAAAYLTANAAKYNIDPKRIAALGESAGGHLALLAAYSPNTPPLNAPNYPGQDFHIAAAIGYYAPSDFLHGTDNNGVAAAYLKVDPANPDRTILAAASPITCVATAVPTLLLHGDRDTVVPFIQSEELLALLNAKGIPATLKTFPGAGHSFDSDASRRQEAIAAVLQFLNGQFGPKN